MSKVGGGGGTWNYRNWESTGTGEPKGMVGVPRGTGSKKRNEGSPTS